ncbi:hypothetical protein J6590_098497 [Homalodisca vitripennis]|nr:hypothetical protein J6590_013789 [Homalodisca vitripennis]KAG8297271.1 hypothetical protein J6590_038875 [Homalodisca vitripennis]KAG8308904.1 hypothetical protein J6590_098497 [Homalodisca vitripennis]
MPARTVIWTSFKSQLESNSQLAHVRLPDNPSEGSVPADGGHRIRVERVQVALGTTGWVNTPSPLHLLLLLI